MLTPSQTEIFLTNCEDFILTLKRRDFFYSQKTYPGLEEFDNGLEETIIGKGLISQEAWEQWECQKLPEVRETLWKELSLTIKESRLTSDFIKTEWTYVQKYFICYNACNYDAKQHIFQCCKTWKEINDFIQNLVKINLEFSNAYNGRVYSSAWEWQKAEWAKRNKPMPNETQPSVSNSPTVSSNSSPTQPETPSANPNPKSQATVLPDKTNAISPTESEESKPEPATEEFTEETPTVKPSSPETAKVLVVSGIMAQAPLFASNGYSLYPLDAGPS